MNTIGISLDEDEEEWKAAMKKGGLGWINVSDLKGQENEVFVQYRGFDIPKNILIDPAGKIIAKDLFGEDLFKKLEAIFKKEAHSK